MEANRKRALHLLLAEVDRRRGHYNTPAMRKDLMQELIEKHQLSKMSPNGTLAQLTLDKYQNIVSNVCRNYTPSVRAREGPLADKFWLYGSRSLAEDWLIRAGYLKSEDSKNSGVEQSNNSDSAAPEDDRGGSRTKIHSEEFHDATEVLDSQSDFTGEITVSKRSQSSTHAQALIGVGQTALALSEPILPGTPASVPASREFTTVAKAQKSSHDEARRSDSKMNGASGLAGSKRQHTSDPETPFTVKKQKTVEQSGTREDKEVDPFERETKRARKSRLEDRAEVKHKPSTRLSQGMMVKYRERMIDSSDGKRSSNPAPCESAIESSNKYDTVAVAQAKPIRRCPEDEDRGPKQRQSVDLTATSDQPGPVSPTQKSPSNASEAALSDPAKLPSMAKEHAARIPKVPSPVRSVLADHLIQLGDAEVKQQMNGLWNSYGNVAASLVAETVVDYSARVCWISLPERYLLRIYKRLHGDDWKHTASMIRQLSLPSAIDFLAGCIGAAVYESVFQQPLPWEGPKQTLSYLSKREPFLTEVLKEGGERRCNNLHFIVWQAARNQLLDDQFQEETVAPIAEELATDFMFAMGSQLKTLGIQKSAASEAAASEGAVDFWKQRHEGLKEVFMKALVIKRLMEVAPKYYTFEWIHYGTEFQKLQMTASRPGINTGSVTWCAIPQVWARTTKDGEPRLSCQAIVVATADPQPTSESTG